MTLTDAINNKVLTHARQLDDGSDQQKHNDAKKHICNEIANRINEHINKHIEQLKQAAWNRSTQCLWRCISKCIERGITDATIDDANLAKKHHGHGKPSIKRATLKSNIHDHNDNKHLDDDAMNSLLEHATEI